MTVRKKRKPGFWRWCWNGVANNVKELLEWCAVFGSIGLLMATFIGGGLLIIRMALGFPSALWGYDYVVGASCLLGGSLTILYLWYLEAMEDSK